MKKLFTISFAIVSLLICSTVLGNPSRLSPLISARHTITYDTEHNTEFNLVVKNQSEKEIDAFDVRIVITDTFGRPIYDSNRFICRRFRARFGERCNMTNIVVLNFDNNRIILPYTEASYSWTLLGFKNATRISAEIVAIHFTDETIWRRR